MTDTGPAPTLRTNSPAPKHLGRRVSTRWQTNLLPKLMVGAVVLAAAAGPAMAQAEALRPPKATEELTAPVILTIIGITLIESFVLFAANLPSKRGHQD